MLAVGFLSFFQPNNHLYRIFQDLLLTTGRRIIRACNKKKNLPVAVVKTLLVIPALWLGWF